MARSSRGKGSLPRGSMHVIGRAWNLFRLELAVYNQEVADFMGLTVDDVVAFSNGDIDDDDVASWWIAVQEIAYSKGAKVQHPRHVVEAPE